MKFEKIQTRNGSFILPIIETYRDAMTVIKTDIYRKNGIDVSTSQVILSLLSLNFLSWFRICQIHDFFSPIKNRVFYFLCRRRSIDISVHAKIGYGFCLGHSMCIVINPYAIIGNNVSVSQFLNIGSNKGKGAIICDGAYIAPMVCTIEDVCIGFNSVIGAGAVVNRDVPNNTTYAGVPAKYISNKSYDKWHFATMNIPIEN